MMTTIVRARTGRPKPVHRLRASCSLLLSLCSACLSPNSLPATEKPAATGGNSGTGGATVQLPPASGAAGPGSAGGAATQAPECRASTECAPPKPYCQISPGRCVECSSNANCSGTGKRYCDSTRGACVLCLNDSQCPATEPYCSPEGNCVECLSSRNCGTQGVACDPVIHHCVVTCDSDADCSSDIGRPYCDAQRSECVQCIANEDCPPVRAHCLLAAGTCEKCLIDSDCAAPTAHCDATLHACAQCVRNADCTPGYNCQAGVCTIIPE